MALRSAIVSALIAIAVAAPLASAQPGASPADAPAQPSTPRTASEVLRDGNAAAIAGDWAVVAQLVDPLLRGQLPAADLAEAHRLGGLAAFFQGRRVEAEAHFLAYLRIDLDAQLDPTLYPPEAISFFNDVKSSHNAELRARRPKARRYWILNLVPPFGQFQNRERTKGFVIGGLIAGFAIANVTSFVLLRRWCADDKTCDEPVDHVRGARQARAVNITAGIGLLLTYTYGVYDGVRGYRRDSRERAIRPFVSETRAGRFIGVAGTF